MSELIESLIPALKEGFLFETIPDGCMLLDEATGKLITLNAAAEAVLTLCDGRLSISGICIAAQDEFGISCSESRAALMQLSEAGVLFLSSSDEPTAAA